MKLRAQIAPQLAAAEKQYAEILGSIMAYTEFCDENGDAENTEYQKLENQLHQLTGKDMTKFNLWEWWEEEGAEVLAFRIALPDPISTLNITKDELAEIVRRIKAPVLSQETAADRKSFEGKFEYYLDDYYHCFLKVNFNTYNHDFFNRQKDKNGAYFEFSIAEITEKLWGNRVD